MHYTSGFNVWQYTQGPANGEAYLTFGVEFLTGAPLFGHDRLVAHVVDFRGQLTTRELKALTLNHMACLTDIVILHSTSWYIQSFAQITIVLSGIRSQRQREDLSLGKSKLFSTYMLIFKLIILSRETALPCVFRTIIPLTPDESECHQLYELHFCNTRQQWNKSCWDNHNIEN